MPARFLHRHKRLTFTLVVIVCLTLFLNYGPWSARGTFARIVTEEVTQRVDITYDSGNTMHYLGSHADPDGTVIGRIRPTSSQGQYPYQSGCFETAHAAVVVGNHQTTSLLMPV